MVYISKSIFPTYGSFHLITSHMPKKSVYPHQLLFIIHYIQHKLNSYSFIHSIMNSTIDHFEIVHVDQLTFIYNRYLLTKMQYIRCDDKVLFHHQTTVKNKTNK